VRRVFIDTSVLFPFSVMDLLLALTEDGVHQVLWTDELLDEWERVIVREHQRSSETAASVTTAIREFFADGRIDREQYADLIAQMPGDDPDDHPHMAAAVAARVDALVTVNLADFPAGPLNDRGVRVVEPDTYLVELFDEQPNEVIATIVRIAGEKTRPPMTPLQVLAALRRAGLERFPARIATRL
jgi:predicted nucleic acid-binding protein